MSPTWRDVEAAKAEAAAENLERDARSYGLPPGYIKGFDLTIDGDTGQLTIDAGFADVAGVFVRRNDSHVLIDEDYGTGVLRLPSLRYYIYITREGQYWVDVSKPIYTKARYGLYHPTYVYRYVAEFYMDVNNKIPFAVSQEQNPGQIIVIASSTYKGLEYDRICDGTRDEVEINAAITYLSETYGGGIVELTEGTFYTAASIVPDNDIVFRGRGWNTIIEKNGNYIAVQLTGNSGSEYSNVSLKDFKIKRESSDTAGVFFMEFTYVDNLLIENVLFYDAYTGALKLDNCDNFVNINCHVQRFKGIGLNYISSQGIISSCTIDGQNITAKDTCYGIKLANCVNTIIADCRIIDLLQTVAGLIGIYATGNGIKINNNFIKNLTSTSASYVYGIHVLNNEHQIINNYIDDVDNTNTVANARGIQLTSSDDSLIANNYIINGSGKGIVVDSNSDRALINSNFCRNNGSDSGIANENEHNFSDAGADTMTSGNSWQQPVASEPSGGTWHKFADPATGWKASKTTWATPDSFSDGLEVTFSEVPAGAKAVRVLIYQSTTFSNVYYRKSGDANISNTPNATLEVSHQVGTESDRAALTPIWLSADYKAQFTVVNVLTDLYIAYPVEYLI